MFLLSLGVPAEEVPADAEERSGVLRQMLASRRVLMVLDNARAEAQVRPLLPGAGGSLVLVTSRSVLPGLEVNERISLDTLPDDDAAAMLAQVIGAARTAAEPEAVTQLAGLCGRLPLALRIAGQLLAAHPAWPVGRLVQMLTGEQDRLARLCTGDLQVRAAFEVSYAQLVEEDGRLFRLLGLHPGPDFDARAAAALAGIGPETVEPMLDRLVEAYLVTEDAASRFGMHDLLRLFARSTFQQTDSLADRNAAETRLVNHYVELAELLDSCVDPQLRAVAEQAGTPLRSMREALTIFQAERLNLMAVVDLAAQRGWDDQVWQLSESIGDSLVILRNLDGLLTVREAALTAARNTGNKGNAAEGRALHNLAYVFVALRRFEEGITFDQQALTIFRGTGDRRSEGPILNSLGSAYQNLERFEEAITSYQQALAIEQEVGHWYGEAMALNNLGNTYQNLERFEEAITSYQQALAIKRESGDRHGESNTLNNLGNAYQNLERFEEAITSYQQALAIKRETGDRHGEGRTLNNLGDAYQELRQPDRAAAYWREAAAAMRGAGDHEAATRLEQLAANTRPRRRWSVLHRRSSS